MGLTNAGKARTDVLAYVLDAHWDQRVTGDVVTGDEGPVLYFIDDQSLID